MELIDGCYVHGDYVYIPDEYLDEKWSHIQGYPNYMISTKARVWSERSQIFLKPKRGDIGNHLSVGLSVNGNVYYEYIHRLMAKAFIPNYEFHPLVRHLDDIANNNDLDNLKWGTQSDNMRDAMINGKAYMLTDLDRRKGAIPRMTPLIATNINDKTEFQFESQAQASRQLKIPQANINKVLKKQRYSAGGYHFKEVIK